MYLSSSCGYVRYTNISQLFFFQQNPCFFPTSKPDPFFSMAASTATKLKTALLFSSFTAFHQNPSVIIPFKPRSNSWSKPIRRVACKAADVSEVEQDKAETAVKDDGKKWVPVVPIAALPRGERRVIIQEDETIMLLWYKDEVFAIENRSPAEGAYSEGLLNAKLTQDGCIVCPTTDSTFDLRTGEIKEWYPKNPVLRVLTPALRKLFVYPVKLDGENIYLGMFGDGNSSGASAEIVFSGKTKPGFTSSDVNIEEVKMVVDEGSTGFGFTPRNELINGKAAIIGFLLLIDFELLTGKGLLKGTGFLDFLYAASNNSL